MTPSKKILISIPEDLLERVDILAESESRNRSELIREALKLYVEEKHKITIRERMKKGYEEMKGINREWAELSLSRDMEDLNAYEAILSESE